MEFDDVTQTGDLPAQDVIQKREPLPWVLLLVVTTGCLVAVGLLWARASSEGARADEAAEAQARAQNEVAARQAKVDELEKRLAELDAQAKSLTAQRDGLLDQVKALEGAGASAPVATVAPEKAPAKPAKKKPTGKKGKKRRR